MTRPALTVLAEDEQMFYDEVAKFARNQIGPLVHDMDTQGQVHPELMPKLFEQGVMGIEIPEKFGGAGSSFFTSIVVIEALATIDPSISVLVDVQNTLVINALNRWATDEQKAKYFPKMASEWVGSYCLSEAGSGSDAFALKTRADRNEAGNWVINGTKLWITNAKEASLFLVFANTDFDKGYKGITAFIVEKGAPGFTVGKKEDKLGIRASSTCELTFEDVEVTDAQVLGVVGKGYKIAIETLNEGRIGIGAQMVGLAQGALDVAMKHMLERKQFGKRLADFQGMQFQYAQCATDIEAARLMVYNAARLKDAGKPFLKEAAMAKLFASQVAQRVSSQCVEFHGGVGFTREYPAEKFYRDAKIGSIYEGTSNMQLQTIAKLMQAQYDKG
ncbi:MAG: acyl-CoA dehydrogenase [Bradymonadia bacterium]